VGSEEKKLKTQITWLR